MDNRQAIAQRALELVGSGYIYGATGWICTQSRIEQQVKQYPKQEDNIRKYGQKWMGKPCYDCAQLTRASAKAAGISLPSGATSQWKANVYSDRGTMDTLPAGEAGIQLFKEELDAKGKPTGKMAHTAVTVGDGTEVEARGHAYGVVRRKISEGKWTHWARYRACSEAGLPSPDETHETLRKGAQGPAVVELQGLLMRAGCPLELYGADGKFGAETERAVKRFQEISGLRVDGIAGPLTWAVMLTAAGSAPEKDEARYRVTIPHVSAEEAAELMEAWPDAFAVQEQD